MKITRVKKAICTYCHGQLQNDTSSNDNWYHIEDEDRQNCIITKSNPIQIHYENILEKPDIVDILNRK